MAGVEERLKAALAAGPTAPAALGRHALGIAGPDALVAKIADAALARCSWAEKDGDLWRLRAVPEAPPGPGAVRLAVVQGEHGATAPWNDGRLGEIEEMPAHALPARLRGGDAVAFGPPSCALDLRALCRALDPDRRFTTVDRAAADWRLPHGAGDDASGMLRTLGAVWDAACDRAAEQGLFGFDALRHAAALPRPRLDLAAFRFGAGTLATLPETPGVYRFLDVRDEVFYVGKARNLRNRLASWFRVPRVPDPKWAAVIARVRDLEFTLLGSELEALLEEHRLIRLLGTALVNIQVDVHPRAPRTLPARSLWILPAVDEGRAALWAHRRGEAIERFEGEVGGAGPGRALSAFFRSRAPGDPARLALAESWLASWQDRIARLDPDAPALAARLRAVLAADPFQPQIRQA